MVFTAFITGATGYIGGSVLNLFLNHSEFSTLEITALVRSQEKADILNSLGFKTIIGDLGNLPLLANAASQADLVIHTADSDDLPAVQALLKGLKLKYNATGKVPSYIHTSGTGVLSDQAAGLHANATIYNDDDPVQIETLPPTQYHRPMDLAIIDADKQGFVKTYIVLPSLIYGLATSKLVDLGLQNQHSMQVPYLISVSLDRHQVGMVGQGKNLWPNVHIDDIANLYIVLYDAIRAGREIGHGREGIYFGENGEHSFYDLCVAIGKVLVEFGKTTSSDPTTFTKEEMDKYFGGSDYFGSNSRCKANRSRAIGWKPTKGTADLFASVRPEVEALIKDSQYLRVLSRFHAILTGTLE
ncbi:hypothetical protein H0H93_009193 [Arthromyces matolae]|nr:hypothetical protein H0H93_009193 [Arthromyces matolae]